MNVKEIRYYVDRCQFDDYSFQVSCGDSGMEQPYLQAAYLERDIVTGIVELQRTRKWRLSYHMTRSEIVQTVFKCCITSMEHRAREAFKYRGRRIFGPHFDVDALHGICGQIDCRKEPS